MSYTVKQLATLASISTRTLHYYDEIGLLKPETIGTNGYRSYGDTSVFRLQQILFYRELDLPLEDIRKVMGSSDYNPLEALESHRAALGRRIERLYHLIQTVDDTILFMKGQKLVNKRQLFEPFSEEKQQAYAQQAEVLYDPEIVRASQKKWKSYSTADKQRIADEGNTAYETILAAMPLGPGSSEAQAGVELWQRHMDYFWTPNLDQLLNLAEMYSISPDFKANFDKIDPNLAEFMGEAVKIYVERKKIKSK
jgi:MerR family transcriptional regulator, thiopeptide resistance regulator